MQGNNLGCIGVLEITGAQREDWLTRNRLEPGSEAGN
jgi:hypothetical protein